MRWGRKTIVVGDIVGLVATQQRQSLQIPDIVVCYIEGPVRASDDCGVSSNLPVLLKYPGGISGVTQPGGAPYLFCS